ncbi:MAG: hypothetical protein DI551_01830 [Micavibrio aeruginosavorus]|uniref:ChrR-like cupin domain-containing protein n=1 Tax=Micavibrio aeruginosavorus TaxID=349221 RepID=A0A2W5Q0F5_9BACT|nr:MAG: hypothetical protein DI551_01830 [Micavibrio aeruginosavorus]
MTKEETYHALLMEYASGCLDEAQALVIATHMSLSPDARKIVAEYESIGGALLKKCCGPVAMKADALKCVMDKIENLPAAQSFTEKLKKKCGEKDMPACLASHMESDKWRSEKEGVDSIHIKTTCCGYTAKIVRMPPDFSMEVKIHPTKHVLAVVLEGAFSGGERSFQRGELAILEKGNVYPLTADAKDGAICFVVKPAQSGIAKWTGEFFSLFCRKA